MHSHAVTYAGPQLGYERPDSVRPPDSGGPGASKRGPRGPTERTWGVHRADSGFPKKIKEEREERRKKEAFTKAVLSAPIVSLNRNVRLIW